MTIRCICIDDEHLARQGVKMALEPYPDCELIGEFSSADELFSNMPDKVDVAFLDIEMPRQSGFDLLDKWPGKKPIIVFVTAYSEYAIKAFEKEALDYLLKPIDDDRFRQVIQRIQGGMAQRADTDATRKLLQTIDDLRTQLVKSAPEVTVKTDEGYLRVALSDVMYIEGIGDHVCFHVNERQLITRNTLKRYVAEFAEYDFLQTHKSFLVNAQKVSKLEKLRFGDYLITMANGDTVRLSRRYKAAIERLTK